MIFRNKLRVDLRSSTEISGFPHWKSSKLSREPSAIPEAQLSSNSILFSEAQGFDLEHSGTIFRCFTQEHGGETDHHGWFFQHGWEIPYELSFNGSIIYEWGLFHCHVWLLYRGVWWGMHLVFLNAKLFVRMRTGSTRHTYRPTQTWTIYIYTAWKTKHADIHCGTTDNILIHMCHILYIYIHMLHI